MKLVKSKLDSGRSAPLHLAFRPCSAFLCQCKLVALQSRRQEAEQLNCAATPHTTAQYLMPQTIMSRHFPLGRSSRRHELENYVGANRIPDAYPTRTGTNGNCTK